MLRRGGGITFVSTLDGTTVAAQNLTLTAGTGNILFTGAVGNTIRLGTVTINSATNVTESAGLTAASLSQIAGTGTTTLNGPVNTSAAAGVALATNLININQTITTTGGGTVTLTNAGLLTIAAAGDVSADGAFLQNGAGPVSTAGDITTTDDDITFTQAVTLTGSVTLSTGAGGAGDITFISTLNGTTPGTENLTLTAGTGNVLFTGAVGDTTRLGSILITSATNFTESAGLTAASLTQSAGTGTTALNGAVNTSAAAGIALTTNIINVNAGITTTGGGTVTFTNAGQLTISGTGDIAADGAVTQNGAGTVSTAGDISTTNDNVSFATDVTLATGITIDTGAGSGNIVFSSKLDGTVAGTQTLTLTAGTGDITLTGAVGSTTRLGTVLITSAANVAAQSSLSTSNLTQLAGTGTTTFNGPVNTNTAAGINLTANNITVNGSFTTTSSGTVIFTNAGLLNITSAGDINSDGSVTQNGTGTVSTAGDITTTGDTITFDRAVMLTGPVNMTTNGANILFSSTVNTAGQTLTLDPGGLNNVTFVADLNGGGTVTIVRGDTLSFQTVALANLTVQTTNNLLFNAAVNVTGTLDASSTSAINLGVNFTGGTAKFNSPFGVTQTGGTLGMSNLLITGAGDFNATLAGNSIGTFAADLNRGNVTIVNATDFTVGTVGGIAGISTGNPLDGGDISLTSLANLVVNEALDTRGGTGGSLTINGGFTLNGGLILGKGNVTLTGSGQDVIINAVFTFPTPLNINAPGNIIIGAAGDVRTSGAASDINLNADSDNNGSGVVRVISGGQLTSSRNVNIRGAGAEIGGTIRAQGTGNVDIDVNGPITAQGGTVASDAGNVRLHDPISGSGSITVSSNTGNVQLDAGVSSGGLTLIGNLITVNGAINTINNGGVTFTNSGTLTLTAPTPINSDGPVTLNGTGMVLLSENINTTGDNVLVTSSMTLVGPVRFDTGTGAGSITISGPLNAQTSGSQSLTLSAGTGDVAFNGMIGQTAALSTMTVLSAHHITVGSGMFITGQTNFDATGDITLNQLVSGDMASLATTGGAIINGVVGIPGGVNVRAPSTALSARTGIGSSNPLTTAVSLLAAQNGATGNMNIVNSVGGLLTLGAVDGINVVFMGIGGGDISISNQSPMTVNSDVANFGGGSVTLMAGNNGGNDDHLTINGAIAVVGGAGNIVLHAGSDLIINDSGRSPDIQLTGSGTITALGERNVIVSPGVLVSTSTGAVADYLPLVNEISVPLVGSTGISEIEFDFGRPGEKNFTITVNWGDEDADSERKDGQQSHEIYRFTDPGRVTFTHRYFGNPDPVNSAAPIPIRITVQVDRPYSGGLDALNRVVSPEAMLSTTPRIQFAIVDQAFLNNNLNAFLRANVDKDPSVPVVIEDGGPFVIRNVGAILEKTGTALNITAVVPIANTPGSGLGGIYIDTTAKVPALAFPPNSAVPFVSTTTNPTTVGTQTQLSVGSRSEAQATAERVVFLRVISPKGETVEDIPLTDTVLDDLPGLFKRLPDGRYQILVREPGEQRDRLIMDVNVRQGKPAGENEATQDRPPTATQQAQPPGMSAISPDAAKPQAMEESGKEKEVARVDVPAEDVDRAWERWGKVRKNSRTASQTENGTEEVAGDEITHQSVLSGAAAAIGVAACLASEKWNERVDTVMEMWKKKRFRK